MASGLTKFPAFNGLHGTVLSLDSDSGRQGLRMGEGDPNLLRAGQGYNVQISTADGSVGQSAKIKGDNLRMPLVTSTF